MAWTWIWYEPETPFGLKPVATALPSASVVVWNEVSPFAKVPLGPEPGVVKRTSAPATGL